MTNKMWGGRFFSSPSAIMQQINASISFDQRMAEQDISGSQAHAAMLGHTGIISKQDAAEIRRGLDLVQEEIASGQFVFKPELEDIHMNVEARLKDLIGEPAGRLHTARSRNDQVATDFKLYVRQAFDHLDQQISSLQKALAERALEHAGTVMPGFTHLQIGQPVTFGHHLLAYVEMLERDRSRLRDAKKRAGDSPLGSAALAGTSFPIDRSMVAEALGFDRACANSMDGVADRDFVLDLLSSAAICSVHLSRLAEEIVIWSSSQFRFVTLSDKFTTGSSIMPQKRNADAAELVRAKPGRIVGSLVSLLMVMKGLPLTYSKDMQEDKEPAFDTIDNLSLALAAMEGMVLDMQPNVKRLAEQAGEGYATATDLADFLVQKLSMPFREAHHVAGSLVALAEKNGVRLPDLSLSEMQSVEPRISGDVFAVLTAEASVASRTSYGGTAPDNVKRAAELWLKHLS